MGNNDIAISLRIMPEVSLAHNDSRYTSQEDLYIEVGSVFGILPLPQSISFC